MASRFKITRSDQESKRERISGCRTFEAHTTWRGNTDACTPFLRLLGRLHIDENVNVSRVDLALDDTEGYLDLNVICEAVANNTINSRIRQRRVVLGYDGTNQSGTTVYIGAEQSDFRIRIYDKAKEHYKPTQPEYQSHWARFKIVMRGACANGFVDALVNTEDLGLLASGILNDKIAFIERAETNITRCEVCHWWNDFVDSVASIKLVIKEETEHKLLKSIDWVKRQIAPTLSLINDARGYFMIREILAVGSAKRTRQQRCIVLQLENPSTQLYKIFILYNYISGHIPALRVCCRRPLPAQFMRPHGPPDLKIQNKSFCSARFFVFYCLCHEHPRDYFSGCSIASAHSTTAAHSALVEGFERSAVI